MARHRYALILLICLALAPAAWGQTSLAPEAGLLLLRNGEVIEGEVTRAGDFYVVTQGEGSELRLPAADVEAFCASLDEAYEFKQRRLSGSGAKPHLDLADWCLRQKLHSRCAQQLVAAMRLEPNNPRLKQLETFLQLAVEAPQPVPQAEPSNAATVSPEELDKTLRALPKGSVEKFSANIQPILLNRCGANQCHGPNAKSEFRLLRPPAGQIASRRFTQRNLYATLKQLNQSNPESSPLVTLPQRRHGTSLTAVFDKLSQSQLTELVAWTKLTAGAPRSSAPQTIGPTQATLSQPAATAVPAAANQGPPGPTPDAQPVGQGVQVMRPSLDKVPDQFPPGGQRFVPRDPYDPELFNRRFHRAK
jgi:hypothetical protein